MKRARARRGRSGPALTGLLLGALLWGAGCTPASRELPVYLTWSREDATTHMVVQYHTRDGAEGSHVHYDREPRGGEPGAYALHAEGFEKRLSGVDRVVHVVELDGLEPDTVYWFAVGPARGGARTEHSFRTPPASGELRFVAGGDMGTGYLSRMIGARAAAQSPHFALLGGDLAYAYGKRRHLPRWERWFADWQASMRTPEGHLIPLVVAIGNHELNELGRDAPASERAPFFTLFFHQDAEHASYFQRSFGPAVALYVLDSGHLVRHADQVGWLEAGLRARRPAPFRFALYHAGLYPAHHAFDGRPAREGRTHWEPVFDAARLTAGIESHDHLQKRSHPLRAGRVVAPEAGTLYLGGGCWGKAHVEEPVEGLAYLAKVVRRRHFWSVRVSGDTVEYTAIGAAGQVYDRVVQHVPAATGSDT